ncbi:MAG: hypothetical protein ACHP6H_04405 [Legionellales bacterium]
MKTTRMQSRAAVAFERAYSVWEEYQNLPVTYDNDGTELLANYL